LIIQGASYDLLDLPLMKVDARTKHGQELDDRKKLF